MRPFFKGFPFKSPAKREFLDQPGRKVGVLAGIKKSTVRKALEDIREKYKGTLEVTTSGSGYYIEVTNKGSSKAVAAKILADKLGADLKNAAALGDSGNDLEIFKVVGYPIAVAGATKAVEAQAKYKTASAKHDGVAKAVTSLTKNL